MNNRFTEALDMFGNALVATFLFAIFMAFLLGGSVVALVLWWLL